MMEKSKEVSIEKLMKMWERRQRVKRLLFGGEEEEEEEEEAAWRKKVVGFLECQGVRYVVIALLLVDLIITALELTSACNDPERVYEWVGTGIVGLLLAKTLTLALAVGPAGVRRRPGLVVDALVLAAALVIDTFLERRGGGLVVVVSLWRVVRIVESAFELSDDAIHAQIAAIVAHFDSLSENVEEGQALEKLPRDLPSSLPNFGFNV